MNWSHYQLAVFAENLKSDGNLFVNAVAGSGKTTVIEECIKEAPFGNVLAIAFGRDIKAELARRLEHLSHVVVKTLNGFGNQCLPRGYRQLKEEKAELTYRFDVLDGDKDIFYKTKRVVVRLAALCKANMYWKPTVYQIEDLMEVHGMSLPKKFGITQIHEYTASTLLKCLQKTKVIDYDDQIALPLFHDFEIPTFDRVYADEAQDLTPAQIELVKRAVGGKASYVGDPRQAIYQFRGADSRAVQNIVAAMSCKELPLSVCYRCAKSIVREAQKKVPHIEYFEESPEGVVDQLDFSGYTRMAEDGDIALCRTTAPLIKECLKFLSLGRKAIVKGREIGTALVELLEAADLSDSDTQEKLDAHVTECQERFKGPALLNLNDNYEALCALFQKCRNAGDVKIMIGKIFDDKESKGVTFMTIHKAKGLENPRVFILHPNLMPHKMATSDEQLLSEDNLWYVGVTRAKRELFWVQ